MRLQKFLIASRKVKEKWAIMIAKELGKLEYKVERSFIREKEDKDGEKIKKCCDDFILVDASEQIKRQKLQQGF